MNVVVLPSKKGKNSDGSGSGFKFLGKYKRAGSGTKCIIEIPI